VKIDSEKTARYFLELSSEQRLSILTHLAENNLNLSKLADLLNATKSEVHRNVNRLLKAQLIQKEPGGNFQLTVYGRAILTQIPSLCFVPDNQQYFSTHNMSNLENRFIQSIGSLYEKKQIKGLGKVLEKWEKIHENADVFVYDILSEVPYYSDIIDVISSKLENKVEFRSIFSEKTEIPEDRELIFQKKDFKKYVNNGQLERRIMKGVTHVVFVTDKEGAIFFPNEENEPDLNVMFTSTNPEFRNWCLDYFEWCWKNSTSFQESKFKKNR